MSSAYSEIVDAFKVKFQQMINDLGLTRDQVYNSDESGLNYKALPTKKTRCAIWEICARIQNAKATNYGNGVR